MTKSKKRFVVINGIVCAFLAVLFIAANIVMSVFFGGLTMYFGGMGLDLDNPDAEAVREEATEFTKTITGEGITLLRNENEALPLGKGNVNLFGWSSTALITGGSGGSGGSSRPSIAAFAWAKSQGLPKLPRPIIQAAAPV